MKNHTIWAYFFILFGALLRVAPHAANFAPIGAIALFSGAYLPKKHAALATLGAMVVSDVMIGFDSLQSRLIIYAALMVSVGIGFWMREDKAFTRIVAGSMLGSVVFFLVTNLVFVFPEPLYAMTWAGQMQSYINGLPFFRNTVLGDLFYTSLFFGAYEAIVAYNRRRILAHDHSSSRTN